MPIQNFKCLCFKSRIKNIFFCVVYILGSSYTDYPVLYEIKIWDYAMAKKELK
jgi:hypothetical protein